MITKSLFLSVFQRLSKHFDKAKWPFVQPF